MKRIILFLSMLCFAGCSSGGSNTPTTTPEIQLEGSQLNLDHTLTLAAMTTTSLLSSMGFADQDAITGALILPSVKNAPFSQLDCNQAISSIINRPPRGSVSVGGSCAPSQVAAQVKLAVSGCAYDFTGAIVFGSLMSDKDDTYAGSMNVALQIFSPGCQADLTGASIGVAGAGQVTVGPLVIEYFEATYSLTNDNGKIVPAITHFYALSKFGALRCVVRNSGSTCFPDSDDDLVDDATDNCPGLKNESQSDTDADRIGTSCDNCPNRPNPDQADADGDGVGDACENDEPTTPGSSCTGGKTECSTADDCPVEQGCIDGCCDACAPDEVFNVSLTCRQAAAINEGGGITGECDQFGRVCDGTGCCVLGFDPSTEPPPDLGNFCDVPCGCGDPPDFPLDCSDQVVIDNMFCFNVGFRDACYIFDGVTCPALDSFGGAGISCKAAGQGACNEIIALGGGSVNVFCDGICCVEP